jgi:5'-nucleotidase (lipoprotein e(P4) family)
MTRLRLGIALALLAGVGALAAGAQRAPADLGIKYVRDSEEYATLARQVYRQAAEAARRFASTAGTRPWAVILDIDETALDNSAYQLERAAYGVPYEIGSWNAWVRRREAGAVPGVVDFVAAVRRGRVAWITNRETRVEAATQANLAAVGLWHDSDRLCAQDAAARTKKIRRAELVAGRGACAWAGQPVTVAVIVGDQLGDFPDRDEGIAGTGSDEAFGQVAFLLPNPMYGEWTSSVTRIR